MNPVELKTRNPSTFMQRAGARLRRGIRAAVPPSRAWRGAIWGALAVLAILLSATAYGLFSRAAPLRLLAGAISFLAAFGLAGLVLAAIWRLLRGLPAAYVWVLASAVPVLALMALTAISVSIGVVAAGLGLLAAASLLGAGISELAGGGWREASRLRRAAILTGLALGLGGLAGGGYWLLDPGSPPTPPPNAAALPAAGVEPLDLPDPSRPGPYSVRSLTYGSGSDRRRPEFGAQADLLTGSVDGSALIERWSCLRTAYWGFDPASLPLNGRVWYPEGEGAFPLVMVAHGQHPMEDFSDPGYAYLGELLASRGFIVVSVDENFLNLSPLADLLVFQTLIEENDLRGWLLLEHLRVWRGWNSTPDSAFYQKADLDRIALIGHSRGGEAVAAAAAFNRLPASPDNANLRFDYNFNIRSVVGIAPAVGAYRPAGRDILLEDTHYLVLHGAHDMDVFTFQGARQYARVHFSGGDWFKAGVYIYGANHGQFNSVWGRKDLFEPVMRVFNLEQLMPEEDQQQAAAVLISAFLEDTLHGETGYRRFFQDLRRGGEWLPETLYLHQYQDASTAIVSAYEEDIDPASTTLAGGNLAGEHLTLWREQPVQAKWDDFGNQAVYLGWDAAAGGQTASYTVEIPPDALALDARSILVFSLADAREDPAPQAAGEAKADSRQPVDLTIEVADRTGEVARLPLSHFSLLQPQLEAQLGKARFLSPFPASEAVLQHFEFPLRDFSRANPAFDPAGLTRVRFLFDRTQAGAIVLDDLGFRDR